MDTQFGMCECVLNRESGISPPNTSDIKGLDVEIQHGRSFFFPQHHLSGECWLILVHIRESAGPAKIIAICAP